MDRGVGNARRRRAWCDRVLGGDLSIEEGRRAAAIAFMQCLAAAAAAAGGVDRLAGVVRLTIYVASTPGFHEQHVVVDGASTLALDVFGPAGVHTRSALGVAALPLGMAVEVEAVFELRRVQAP